MKSLLIMSKGLCIFQAFKKLSSLMLKSFANNGRLDIKPAIIPSSV